MQRGGREDDASTAGAVGGVGTVDGITLVERGAMLLYYGSTWIVQIVDELILDAGGLFCPICVLRSPPSRNPPNRNIPN